MTLSGQNPLVLPLPRMLDVVFTLLVEAWVNAGHNVIDAIDRVKAIADDVVEAGQQPTAAVDRVPDERENTAALAALEKMMAGTGRV